MSTEFLATTGDKSSVPSASSHRALVLPVERHTWKQAPLANYFPIRRRAHPAPVGRPVTVTSPVKSKTVRHALLKYHPPKKAVNRITRYSTSLPSYDLFDSWGHSLEVIDTSTTFRVFLQNPNGFSVHRNNHLLIQDLQTCYQYGAGALCFPETKTNWNQEGQVGTLHKLFRNVWQTSVLQPSQTPDPFLSAHQPEGTLTAICDNWVSRVFAKGEDPYGLGRWSYVTLRGKASGKITIVTAYNATYLREISVTTISRYASYRAYLESSGFNNLRTRAAS